MNDDEGCEMDETDYEARRIVRWIGRIMKDEDGQRRFDVTPIKS